MAFGRYAPRKRGYSRRSKRGAFKKAFPYRGRRRRPFMYRGIKPTPFAPCFFTKLRYCANHCDLSVSGGSASHYTFRVNSLFDPDFTSTGHQPRYYDTLCGANNGAAPYRRYVVYGVKISAIIQTTTGIACDVAVGARTSDATIPDDVQEAGERTGYKIKGMTYYQGGPAMTRFNMYFPVSRIFGVSKKTVLTDENYSADYANNPTNVAYLDIMTEAIATSTSPYFADVMLTYYCKFYSRNDVATS